MIAASVNLHKRKFHLEMSEENASTQENVQIDSMAGNMAGSLLGNQENEESNKLIEEEEEVNDDDNNNNEEEENKNEDNNEEENKNEDNNEEENKNESEKNGDENKLDNIADGLTGQLLGSQDNKSENHESGQATEPQPPTSPHSRASQVRFSNSSANRSQKSLNALSEQKADNNAQSNDHSKTMPPPAVHEPGASEGSQKSGRSRKSSATNQAQSKKSAEKEEEEFFYSQYDSEFQDEIGATGSSYANRLTRSELDDLVLSVICGETPVEKVPPSNLPQLISGLREARDERISRRKPDEAEVCDSCLLIARHTYNEHMKVVAQKNKMEEIKNRLQVAKEDLANLRDQIDLEDAQQASTNENQVMELLDRQQADDEEFRNTWRSPKKLRIYNRTSNQLRSLKTQTILLLNARKYSEMRQVDRLAKKQEEMETADNYQLMNAEYTQSHHNLERKHMSEMKTLIDAQETKNEQKRALAKIRLDIAQKRVDNLQAQYNELQDPNKVWNLYYRNTRSKAATRKSATRKRLETRNYATLALPPLQTPRSARTRSARYSGL